MSEADSTIPTTVTRKRRRGSGFRYSSKKALNRSRLLRETKRAREFEIGSVRKALTYPCEVLGEIGVVDLAECSTGSFGIATLKSVEESPEERFAAYIGGEESEEERSFKVSKFDFVQISLTLTHFHLTRIVFTNIKLICN
jgi:hypothetical protein